MAGAVLTEDLSDEDWLLQSSRDTGTTGAESLHPYVDLVARAEVLDCVPGGKKRLLVRSCPVCTYKEPSRTLQVCKGQTDTHPKQQDQATGDETQRQRTSSLQRLNDLGQQQKKYFREVGHPTLPRRVGYELLAEAQLLSRRLFASKKRH